MKKQILAASSVIFGLASTAHATAYQCDNRDLTVVEYSQTQISFAGKVYNLDSSGMSENYEDGIYLMTDITGDGKLEINSQSSDSLGDRVDFWTCVKASK